MNRLITLFLLLVLCSCQDTTEDIFTDNFDRRAMLTNWVDNIIVPAHEIYDVRLQALRLSKDEFIIEGSTLTFENLRLAYKNAYLAWQAVSMFDIGKAEEIGLRNFSNIYPTDTQLIEENIQGGNYNLELPSNFDAQGFPALDYLLFGLSDNDDEIINILQQTAYSSYLNELVDRLKLLNLEVLNDWRIPFRSEFIENDGSSATASTDKLVNDFLFYYEKFLRAGKIGIPAGVFSGNEIPTSVEAPYSGIYSKELFFAAYKAVQDFFKGLNYDGSQDGSSLEDYLNYVATENGTSSLADPILAQWTIAEAKVQALDDSFRSQVENDNIKMLEAYDELQKAVVLLKVDMLQALNIQVDFVDADGD